MTKWVAAPLVSLLLFAGSGWLNALERTTEASARLAESSRSAPATTRSAAEDVKTIPAIARLTERQSIAFRALAGALAASSIRVKKLNESIGEQVDSVDRLGAVIDGFGGAISCIRARVESLAGASARVPPGLGDITALMRRLAAIQDGSIAHLKSINRKLTLLGVAAAATDVKAPPLPSASPPPVSPEGSGSVGC